MKFFLEFVTVRLLIFILSLIPYRFVSKLGSAAGLFAYYAVPIRRSVALTNLSTAFPDKTVKERKRICRETYRNFGMIFLEYLRLGSLASGQINQLVSFDPPDCLRNAMAQNQGVIAITGHFSGFELLGVAAANSGIPIDVVVKAMKNPRIEGMLDRFRSRTNLGVIKVKDGFSKVVESTAQKRLVALVADQDAGPNGIFVNFFGVKSSAPAGPAVLALRSKAPMVAGFNIRNKNGTYIAKMHTISYNDLPESTEDKLREITHRYSSLLESYIRQYPEQYFWMHKRWKSAFIYNGCNSSENKIAARNG